jgi:hypothetical protein
MFGRGGGYNSDGCVPDMSTDGCSVASAEVQQESLCQKASLMAGAGAAGRAVFCLY